MAVRVIIFLILNFAALGLGSMFTGKGVPSEWYQNLNQAPWTPPGWVFGFAWTTIMILFAVFMAKVLSVADKPNYWIVLFAVQWILNVLWNPVFFKYHHVALGLVIISALTVLMAYFLFANFSSMKMWTLLVLPYFVWLVIATSLNGYIFVNN